MAERGKRRAAPRGLESEPPVSDEVEVRRPRTNLGLGPARSEAMAEPPAGEPLEIEPVPEDFAKRLGLEDNDAPLPRETAVLNLDMVFRSSSDDDQLPSPSRSSRPQDEDAESDPFDEELPEGQRLVEDELAESDDMLSYEPPRRPAQPAASPAPALESLPPLATLWPFLIVVGGLLAGYLIASLLLAGC